MIHVDIEPKYLYIDRFCGLLLFKEEVRRKCLTNLSIFLCHRYAQVSGKVVQHINFLFCKYGVCYLTLQFG